MFSLQEVLEKTAPQRKTIQETMDRTHGGFHPHENSIYDGLGDADKSGIYETLSKVPLSYWLAAGAVNEGLKDPSTLKEYIGHSGSLTTGVTGASGFNYLLPDVIYTGMLLRSRCADIVPLATNLLECPGPELKVDAEVAGSFKPKFTTSGGDSPFEAIATAQGTIKPRTFNLNIGITNEMLEDNLFNVMATHLQDAGAAMGEHSTKMALYPVMDDHLNTATTYRISGAYNTFNTGGASTLDWTDITEGWGLNNEDGFKSNVAVVAPKAPGTLLAGAAGYPHELGKAMSINLNSNPITNMNGVDIVVTSNLTSTDIPVISPAPPLSGLYSTTWHVLVMDKEHAIQTVRKRWLKIENYSDPIKDLVGAVVSARQGHLVAYADAVCVGSYA